VRWHHIAGFAGEAKQRQKAFKVSLVTFFWADAFGGASYAQL